MVLKCIDLRNDKSLDMVCVTKRPEQMIDGTMDTSVLKRIVSRNKDKCDVFVFKDQEGTVVGTLSVIYKGGVEVEYKIKNIDAFVFNVKVLENFRGRGYAGEMLLLLMDYLHKKSIDRMFLAVSTNNNSAIRAYKKIGAKIICKMSFVRALRINIPYRTL